MVLRKRALLADAIAHSTLAGVSGAFLIGSAFGITAKNGPLLLCGAVVAGLLSVGLVNALVATKRIKEDAGVALALSGLFGLGVVFLSIIQISGLNAAGLNHFIFGSVVGLSRSDAYLTASIASVVLIMSVTFYKELLLTTFDGEYAELNGFPMVRVNTLLTILLILVSVAGIQLVGLIMVISLLIIPPVAARLLSSNLQQLLIGSGVIGSVSGGVGAYLSGVYPRYPAGSVIVLVAGALLMLSLAFSFRRVR